MDKDIQAVQEQNITDQSSAIITSSTSTYSGPVPPPAILEKLEAILPGSAERIFNMAEKDQNAAIEIQKMNATRAQSIVENVHNENKTSLWMAYSFCIICLLSGLWLVHTNHEYIGSVLLGTSMVGVVSAFLYRDKNKQ